ncbi:hypothetical protein NA56DRAFT_657228 [Hyaloscypha hepaticicola]|uniref:Uncharacterized protein n=1 Tax=Hyaloscypha hepaticicola TaxID=2082293 RepID=A0A2J6QA68_9HELO|nr:hypothetical protein NA56DRAFT_657228 [Hyaloscypha hepaticicola]
MNIRPMALDRPAIWYLGVARCSTFRPKLYLNKRHSASSHPQRWVCISRHSMTLKSRSRANSVRFELAHRAGTFFQFAQFCRSGFMSAGHKTVRDVEQNLEPPEKGFLAYREWGLTPNVIVAKMICSKPPFEPSRPDCSSGDCKLEMSSFEQRVASSRPESAATSIFAKKRGYCISTAALCSSILSRPSMTEMRSPSD